MERYNAVIYIEGRLFKTQIESPDTLEDLESGYMRIDSDEVELEEITKDDCEEHW